MKKIYVLFALFSGYLLTGQVYDDYYGAGHNLGMNISGSGTTNNDGPDAPENSVSGATDELTLSEASRFLAQAALGYSYEQIEAVRNTGLEAWVTEQIDMAIPRTFQSRVAETYEQMLTIQNNENPDRHISDFAFYQMTFDQKDLLRQRMAFAWSQIIVVTVPQGTIDEQLGFARYYDILYGNAFGNFRDMLYDITMSVPMGLYLSSYNNRKFNPGNGSEPDENFAREIMQLFSIGVHELEINGNVRIDPNSGNPIETYDIQDVAELAKVFTGLSASQKRDGSPNGENLISRFEADWTKPMKMVQEFHEEGPKNFMDKSIPPGQSGMQDINDAIDYLFNHPNTGPFLSKRLIQHMVKSNPSPAYVARVARVFNNNGNGTRGDLEAVTKAILFDPEARECDFIQAADNGKLIQPMERFIALFKAFNISTPSGKFFLNDTRQYFNKTRQAFNASPSVFNFFQFDYREEKNVAPNDLVSPEFQIFNSNTSIAYINELENALKRYPFNNRTGSGGEQVLINDDDRPVLDFSDELEIYRDSGITGLLDRLNILLCRGQLTSEVRDLIIATINENIAMVNNYEDLDVVHDCIYYIMVSPDYMIQL